MPRSACYRGDRRDMGGRGACSGHVLVLHRRITNPGLLGLLSAHNREQIGGAIVLHANADRELGTDRTTADMVWIPGGTFRMGPIATIPEEAPSHRVTVDGFWIDRAPVTNGQFKAFVNATGHVTNRAGRP